MKILIRRELESYSVTGEVWRAYRENGTPLYMGMETREALIERVKAHYPHIQIEFEDWI